MRAEADTISKVNHAICYIFVINRYPLFLMHLKSPNNKIVTFLQHYFKIEPEPHARR